ncbi:MAG: SPOR domain-containing protein [Thioploca sp.]|nr:SPOR domain-containing protein [Thioploca sp.]
MPPRNVRRPITEHYDPKQRIVGGIVLFLLMLLIYSLLKLVLGFSYVPEGRFEIGAPLTAEILSSANGLNKTQTLAATDSSIASPQINYPLPSKFVFLDLKGNPMQKEVYQATTSAESAEIYTANSGEGKWYVQAASFREEALAQNLVQKSKIIILLLKHILSKVTMVGMQYGSHLKASKKRLDNNINNYEIF